MIFSESEPAVAFGYGKARGRFEKDSNPPDNQHILPGNSSPIIDSAPSATCRVIARRAKPEADRLFSLADLRIGKRKLTVLGALSEAGGSSLSLVTLATSSKNISHKGYAK